MRAREWGCGFSRYVTLGNQADVSAAEVLAGFSAHSRHARRRPVRGGLRRRPRARERRRAVVAAGRPVVLLAPGRSAAGARAARSHTGSLASELGRRRRGVPRAAASCASTRPASCSSSRWRCRATSACEAAAWRSSATAAGPGASPPTRSYDAGFSVPEFDAAASRHGCAKRCRAAPASNPVDFALATIEPDAFARAAARRCARLARGRRRVRRRAARLLVGALSGVRRARGGRGARRAGHGRCRRAIRHCLSS